MADVDFDVDAALEAWLDKEAAAAGIDPRARNERDLGLWRQWKTSKNPQDFQALHDAMAPIIYGNQFAKRSLSSTTLPVAAVRGELFQNFHSAVARFNPEVGMALASYVTQETRHTGRYLTRYQNIGKIAGTRSDMIGLLQNREAALRESLGREPTTSELADDMLANRDDAMRAEKITPKAVDTLRRELRRDLMTEGSAGDPGQNTAGEYRDRLVFLHGSLNPEQQLVLEHSFPDFGKTVIEDPMELGKALKMSPQKVRAIKKQIDGKGLKHMRAAYGDQ